MNNNIDDIRKAAIEMPKKDFIIKIEVKPDVIILGKTAHITTRFFSRSSIEILKFNPSEVDEPVMVMIGDPAPREKKIIYLRRKEKGVYECDIKPTVSGVRTYSVKKSKEETYGELVEIIVLDKK